MSELRKDPIVGRWVIISTQRGRRPSDWANEPNVKGGGVCPFCPGNEEKTPPEIMAIRPISDERDIPGWQIRVVPNKFPVLQIEGALDPKGFGNYDMMNGIGAHEVIIETPNHASDLAELTDAQILHTLLVYRDRILDLGKDLRFKYILIFKNHGVAAGASLEHSHSQLIATPIIPKRVLEELEGSRHFYIQKERCVYCDIMQQELKGQARIVSCSDHYLSIAPFAPRFPFETWILPQQHFSHYEKMPEFMFRELASALKDTLTRINNALGFPPFNYILHSSPVQESMLPEYHWHIEIIPKLTKVAGFEWGSGFYINPTPPELAAQHLRNVNSRTP
ncbi:MAG: galactose-1-phosphate uridylyltransferase [bacterium]